MWWGVLVLGYLLIVVQTQTAIVRNVNQYFQILDPKHEDGIVCQMPFSDYLDNGPILVQVHKFSFLCIVPRIDYWQRRDSADDPVSILLERIKQE